MKTLAMQVKVKENIQCHVQLMRALENTLQLTPDEFARLVQFAPLLLNYAHVVSDDTVMVNHVVGFRRWETMDGRVYFDRFMITPKGGVDLGTTPQHLLA